MNDLAELWQTHCAIGLRLLGGLPAGAMAVPVGRDGRQVRQLFMHCNDLRLRWVANTAPDLAAGRPWFEQQPERATNADDLHAALERSGAAVGALIARCAEAGTGVQGFPGSLASFLAYLVAHDAYHWGEAGLALAQAGLPLDAEVALDLWRGWWGRVVPPGV